MAAGQHHVSRRRVFDGYSRKEYLHCRNGTRDAELKLGRDDGVRQRNSSNFWNSDHRRDGFVGGTKREDLDELSRGDGFNDAPASELGLKGRKLSASEEGAQLPPQKKRKFSPIIWDVKEKEVRISSKNRVVWATALSSPPKPSTQVSHSGSDDPHLEGSIPMNLVQEVESVAKAPEECGPRDAAVSGSPANFSPLPSECFGSDNQKGDQVEEECSVPARNVSMSRWALDSDSPREICQSYDDRTPERREVAQHTYCSNSVLDTERSSPESGEFRREGSEGVNSGSSMSGDGHFVGPASRDECSANESYDDDDSMEIDEKDDEDIDTNQFDSDSEDDIDSHQTEEPKVSVKRDINMLQGCRSVCEYEKLNRISEGAYGVVYRARDKKTGEIVALKKVKMGIERDGFPLSALREINILLSFRHPSVVDVKEVVMGDLDSVFMVMEYMEHDLKGLMEKMKYPFSASEVKCLMLQLLEGVKYLHDNWVLHRDLKTSNLLLNNKGELKVCDLGLSRQYGSPLKPYTHLVVTLWYRAPELLLGTKQYSTAIDMWSVGCIMAEFLAKKPLFTGETEVSQLDKIFEVLGAPNETNWPGFSELPGPGVKVNFKAKQQYSQLRKKFPAATFTGSPTLSESGFDLLSRLLTYDPEKRISAEDALDHDWFREVPLPKSKDFMPTFPPSMPKIGKA